MLASPLDVMDSSILFGLESIAGDKRREEAEVVASFQAALPLLQGATVTGLARTTSVRKTRSLSPAPRLANLAQSGAAIFEVAGWEAKAANATLRGPGDLGLNRWGSQRMILREDKAESPASKGQPESICSRVSRRGFREDGNQDCPFSSPRRLG